MISMKENYQKILDKVIEQHQKQGEVPTLLLHSCCAPCSSYVLEYLSQYFSITVFYYNPNIWPAEEYEKRVEEQKQLILDMPAVHPVSFLEGAYCPETFFAMARGMEQLPEKGERCFRCYEMRLRESAAIAKEKHFDYFCTTLSVSPLKNVQWLNEIGRSLGEEYHIRWLCSDFKKREGYKRSVQLSEEYGLYRQNYCGCVFSKNQI